MREKKAKIHMGKERIPVKLFKKHRIGIPEWAIKVLFLVGFLSEIELCRIGFFVSKSLPEHQLSVSVDCQLGKTILWSMYDFMFHEVKNPRVALFKYRSGKKGTTRGYCIMVAHENESNGVNFTLFRQPEAFDEKLKYPLRYLHHVDEKNTRLPDKSCLPVFFLQSSGSKVTARMVDPDQSNAQRTQDQSTMSFAFILNAIYACFKKKRVGPETPSIGEQSGSQDVPSGPAGTSGNPAPRGRPATGHPRGRDQPQNEETNNESVPGEQQNETGGPSGSEPAPPRKGRPPTGHPKGRGQPEDDELKDGDEETKSEEDELKDEDANPTDGPVRPGSLRQAKE